MSKNDKNHVPVDFQALFEATPELYLVLDPHLTIVTANKAYLKATGTNLEAVAGRYIFDVFPDNPGNVRARATANLRASLRRVLATGKPDTMAVQQYDIPVRGRGSRFETRFWSPINTPVLDAQNEVLYIIHRVEDVTDFIRAQEAHTEQSQLIEARTREMEVEMFERAQELQRLNNALRQANAHRDLVLESAAEAIVALDQNWRITYLNGNAASRVESEKESLVGKKIWDLFPSEKGSLIGQRMQEIMDNRQSAHFDYFNESSQRWTENRVYPSPEGLVLFSTDVTQEKRIKARFQEMQARLHMAIRVAQLGFWEIDLLTQEVYFSPECKQQLGYGEAEWPDDIEIWRSRVHPDDLATVDRNLEYCRAGNCSDIELEYRLAHKDGGYRWIYARFMPIDDGPATRRLLVTHLDVTQRKQSAERMRHSAYHDALTDLPNRALIYDHTERLIAQKSVTGDRFAVLFMDLDRFKPINDQYGHAMGDLVLKTVSERLAASVRADDLVGRLAGDEFIVILADIDCDSAAAKAAEHICELMAKPYKISGHELRITPSVGISLFPRDGRTVDTLIHAADAAMYSAKEGGHGSYQLFSPAVRDVADPLPE